MSQSQEILSLDTPWAIGEKKYNKILQVLSNSKVENILEFGSGRSTVRLHKDFPEAEITSVESQTEFYTETTELLRQYQANKVVVLHCPLKRIRIGIRSYVTYGLNIDSLESDIDFVLIDGPVESLTLRGREAPLYMIFNFLKVGGVIALDDYHRHSSKQVVTNWLNSYENNLEILDSNEGIIFLRKIGEQKYPAFPGIASIVDNYWSNGKLILQQIKNRLKRKIG